MSPGEWFASLSPHAQAAAKRWNGMKVSCCLAQAALETRYGKKIIGGWNLWGMKDLSWNPGKVSVVTHEVVNGKSVETTAEFEDFSTPEEAFGAYGRLLTNARQYEDIHFTTSLDDYIDKLSKHWATDPNYAAKVKKIIDNFSLTQYDI